VREIVRSITGRYIHARRTVEKQKENLSFNGKISSTKNYAGRTDTETPLLLCLSSYNDQTVYSIAPAVNQEKMGTETLLLQEI
jgi:hypothetical protein